MDHERGEEPAGFLPLSWRRDTTCVFRRYLAEGLSKTAFAVPHRDEYLDTMAFLIRGPMKTLLYVPDTDTWDT